MDAHEYETRTRVGQIVSKALFQHLAGIGELPAPGGQTFEVATSLEPRIDDNGRWWFTFHVRLPELVGSFTYVAHESDGGLNPKKLTFPLPPKDFDHNPKREFPSAHQQDWNKLLDAVEDELTRRGFAFGSSPEDDFDMNTDYYLDSPVVTVGVKNPAILTRDLAVTCQAMLMNRPFSFFIAFELFIEDPAYKGKNEELIVREDRIVEDWNLQRLRQEFPGRFTW